MPKRVEVSEPGGRRIRVSDTPKERIDPDVVARALGAERCPEKIEGTPGPITLYALRTELIRRRQSSGGRPGIAGTSLRAKVPLSDDDWARLEALAASLSVEGFVPSAGQVASVLLKMALRSVAGNEGTQGLPGDANAILEHELAAQQESLCPDRAEAGPARGKR
jgi:hypothetical protein